MIIRRKPRIYSAGQMIVAQNYFSRENFRKLIRMLRLKTWCNRFEGNLLMTKEVVQRSRMRGRKHTWVDGNIKKHTTKKTFNIFISCIAFHTKNVLPSRRFAEIENLCSFNGPYFVPGSAQKLRNHRREHHFHVIYESESIERRFMTCFLYKWLRKYHGRALVGRI